MRKKAVLACGVLFLVFAMVLAAKVWIEAKLNPRAVEAELSKALGVQVHTEGVSFDWAGRFEFSGIKLEQESKPFLLAKVVRVNLSLLRLLGGKVVLNSVAVEKPVVHLDYGVSRDLTRLFQQKPSSLQRYQAFLSQGEFTYEALNGQKITFHDIHGRLDVLPGEVPVHLEFQDNTGGHYGISGVLKSEGFNLQGTLNQAALADLVNPFGMKALSEVQGKVNGKFALSGNLETLALESNFSVDSGIFNGPASLEAWVFPNQESSFFKGKFSSDSGEMRNIGKFKHLEFAFYTTRSGFVFRDGRFLFSSGNLDFSGKVRKDYALSLNFKSQAFLPFSLSTFSGWGVQSEKGTVEGKVGGKFPYLSIWVKGGFPTVWIGKNTLNNVSLSLLTRTAYQEARFDKVAIHSNQGSLSFHGDAKWDNLRNLHITLSDLDAGSLASFFGLKQSLSPISLNLSGSVNYDRGLHTWSGEVLSGAGKIHGETFEAFSGKFSSAEKKPVLISGVFRVHGRSAFLSGEWRENRGKFTLQAKAFPVEHQAFHGIADFAATFRTAQTNSSEITFSLLKGSYGKRAVPPLSGTILLEGNKVDISSLKMTGVSPPLSLTGNYDLESRKVRIQGKLTGQDSKALLAFFPGKLPKISGFLYGDFLVSGVYPALDLSFSGHVKAPHFESFTFGEGDLSIEGTPPLHLKIRFSTPLFSLENFALMHQLVPGLAGTGTLRVSRDIQNPDVSVEIRIPHPTLHGKELSALEGSFLYHPPEIRIHRLLLPLANTPMALAGKVNLATKKVDLSTRLNGERFSDFAKMMGRASGLVDANLFGNLEIAGPFAKPHILFQGEGKEIHFPSGVIGNALLKVEGAYEASGFSAKIHASKIPASSLSFLQKAFPGLAGELELSVVTTGSDIKDLRFGFKNGVWKGKKFPSFQGSLAYQAPWVKFSRLEFPGFSPPFYASGEVNTQSHAFSFHLALNGQRVGDLAKTLGFENASADARLYGPLALSGDSSKENARFSGKGSGIRFGDFALGSGSVAFDAASDAGSHFNVHILAHGISAGEVRFLHELYPGLSGIAGFDVRLSTASPNQAKISFSLTHAVLKGRSFPELEASASWDAPRLEISSLTAPTLSPPLLLKGELDTRSRLLHLSGELQGERISDLMLLAGASRSEVNGKMYGPVTISGSENSPSLEFHGEVSNLDYRGTKLGNGKLDLTARPESLNGKLILDNPISLDPNSSLVGNVISRIPSIGNILGQVTTNVSITGVLISGTPKHPQFTPTLQRTTARSNQQQNQVQPNASGSSQQNPVIDILNQIFKKR